MMLLIVTGLSALFGLACFAALCVVASGAVRVKAEADAEIARLQAELAKVPKTRDGFDYDRLAEAMARHSIQLSELRQSRARQGLDTVPQGRFGEHES